MARSAAQQKIYNKERYIGRKAADMAEKFLLAKLKRDLHIRNEGFPEGPILEDTVIKAKMGEYRLLGLNLRSSKTGFILHYGFTGVRSATTVLLSHQRYKKTATKRKAHKFHLPEKNLFDHIYDKSGAIEYLTKALTETRSAAIEASIDGLLLKLNKIEDER